MLVIKNASLVGQGVIHACDVAIENGRVCQVAEAGTLRAGQEIDADGLYLSHGFLDIHLHGGGGHDFMDGTAEACRGIAKLHLSHGTTSSTVRGRVSPFQISMLTGLSAVRFTARARPTACITSASAICHRTASATGSG